VSVAEHVRLPIRERGIEACHEELYRLVFLGLVKAFNEIVCLIFSHLTNSEVKPVGILFPVNIDLCKEFGVDIGLQSTHDISSDFTVIALLYACFILLWIAAVWVTVIAADLRSSYLHDMLRRFASRSLTRTFSTHPVVAFSS